jgi:peptidoglycan-N-acetylglucosamine deacetylase
MTWTLTFDDGPGPSTPALLDVLAAAGVRATFFLLGSNIERRPDVARRIAREGHVLGNHTFSHARPVAIDAAALVEEITRTDALIAELGGARVPPLRLPYGLVGADPRLAVIARLGREHIGWTADFQDWLPCDATELAARMRAHVAERDDAVLDLHDSSRAGAERPWTVEAVRLFTRA